MSLLAGIHGVTCEKEHNISILKLCFLQQMNRTNKQNSTPAGKTRGSWKLGAPPTARLEPSPAGLPERPGPEGSGQAGRPLRRGQESKTERREARPPSLLGRTLQELS